MVAPVRLRQRDARPQGDALGFRAAELPQGQEAVPPRVEAQVAKVEFVARFGKAPDLAADAQGQRLEGQHRERGTGDECGADRPGQEGR